MNKIKLKILFLSMYLFTSITIRSMNQERGFTHGANIDPTQQDFFGGLQQDQENSHECPVCFEERELISLQCEHKLCQECLTVMIAEDDPLKTYLKKCPLCRKSFIGNDYDTITSPRQNDDTLPSLKTIKSLGVCCLLGYGLYRLFSKKNPATDKPLANENSWSNWLSKKLSTTKQHTKEAAKKLYTSCSKPPILVSTLVSAGTFAILTAKQIDLRNSLHNYIHKRQYRHFVNPQIRYKNPFIKHTLNVGCSIIAGFLANNCYTFFSGEHYNSKNKPNLPKEK